MPLEDGMIMIEDEPENKRRSGLMNKDDEPVKKRRSDGFRVRIVG